ncbi:hypothetical protein [Macrococcoides caseolyticum]|uniref:hypothetical protein n=1 Tax=Macrococcoides caseolyticum TaxID=69966 RepID=UPI001F430C0E|nr:hypothetical protein [Macrococcus caseolyticus]MCE4956848.1 hypothetical protein [Macrococcus caseolyticus]
MQDKWGHINKFIKHQTPITEKKKIDTEVREKEKFTKNKLIAQVKKPIKEFDYHIDSFFNYVYRTIVMPNKIIELPSSSKYFYFALTNFLVYALLIFLLGVMHSSQKDVHYGVQFMVSGVVFTLISIFFTYLIQMVALNRTNNFYKVFVDSISYYTIYNVFVILEFIAILCLPDTVIVFYMLRFLIMMTIPFKLFVTYRELNHTEIDVFPLHITFIVIMVMYIFISKDIDWLNYFQLNNIIDPHTK